MSAIIRFALLLVLAAGCADERSLDLLIDDGEDAESEQRRLRMNVTVTVDQSGTKTVQNLDVRTLARDYVLADCFGSLRTNPGGKPFMTGGSITMGCRFGDMVTANAPTSGPPTLNAPIDCDQAMCRSEAAICVANRLLELSKAAGTTTFVVPNDGVMTPATVTVPPQECVSAS